MTKFHLSSTAKIIILVVIYLIILNGAAGCILIVTTKNAIREQIRNRMLDVSNTAAANIDGDIYEKLQAEDKGTPEYTLLLNELNVYRENIELEYIYGIRDNGDKNFTFTIDPDPVDPGEFGEPIVYTDALYQASLGTPSVDEEAYTDEWGKFYSAYSPVRNSSGDVVGIIAVDFDATWYEHTIYQSIRIIVISCVVSVLVGIIIVIIVTSRLRNRLRILDNDMTKTEEEIDNLAALHKLKFEKEKNPTDSLYAKGVILYFRDEIDVVSDHIHLLLDKIQKYTDFISNHSYVDGMTGLGNRKAYIKKVKEINENIEKIENFAFTTIIFNVKDLRQINKTFGYDAGDFAIRTAGKTLEKTFPFEYESIFHLNGGEYAVIIEKELENSVEGIYNLVEAHLKSQNEKVKRDEKEASYEINVQLSKGYATYDSTVDKNFGEVLHRAEENLLKDKQ